MRCHSWKVQWKMGCVSLVNLEKLPWKPDRCQVVQLHLCKREVNIPFVVTKDAVCSQTLKNRLVGLHPQATVSRAVGHCLMRLNLGGVRKFRSRLGLKQFAPIGSHLLRTSFDSGHFS